MQNPKLYACRRMGLLPWLLVATSGMLAAPVWAASSPLVAVEAVQYPAWIERDGASPRPIIAGERMQAADRLSTGAGGRALLRLADGSGVKLGENAQLGVAAVAAERHGVLKASLDVARGAFRFTTGLFAGVLRRRDVDVRVATMTAGIRGTDVWGKSDADRDLVCLLEGRISVSHAQGSGPQVMDRPLSFYAAAKGQAPGGVLAADAAQVAAWARETELEPGAGIVRANGVWAVRLATLASEREALALSDATRALGYATAILPLGSKGDRRYRVGVDRLASRDEARALAARLQSGLALTAPPQVVRMR